MEGGSNSTAEYRKRNKLKTAYRVKKSLGAIYTGGPALLSSDGLHLYSTLGETVQCTHTQTGDSLVRWESASDVTALALTPNPSEHSGVLLIARRSLDLFFHTTPPADSDDVHPFKMVSRAHDAPIITASADPTGSIFATGSADGMVKCWSAAGQCTHIFKGHGGVVSAFGWDVAQAPSRMRLFSGADDCRIRVWDLKRRACEAVLEGHHAVVRGLSSTEDGATLVSGSRDKVVNIWNIAPGPTATLRSTIPVLETIESCGLVSMPASASSGKGKAKQAHQEDLIWTGGGSGLVKLWSLTTGKLVASQPSMSLKSPEIVSMQHLSGATPVLVTVRVDQNIITHDLQTLQPTQQMVGFNDEVIDLTLLRSPDAETEDRLAAATNSEQIRVYDISDDAKGFSNTALLCGHTDVVLCLASTTDGSVLMSGSKDCSIRFWMPLRTGTPAWACVGRGTGHVESIGAVALPKLWSPRTREGDAFAASASQDCTVKLWHLSALNNASDEELSVPALCTQKIHSKDINSLDIAPNDKLLVSGSQDKTAKLFSIHFNAHKKEADLKHVGTFAGHKRGVWSVKFSKTDQVVATASGDKTVKLWSVESFACLKTFEGHTNSVLRVDFLTNGLQLASCASDGLVKIWNIKDEETAATLDNHEEKIWALTSSKDEKLLLSGGADSVITFWEDVTREQEELKETEAEELILKNQDYENFVAKQDFSSAILLALSLDQPRRLLNLFTAIVNKRVDADSVTGSKAVDHALRVLSPQAILQLLGFVRGWNTSIRTSDVAQTVLNAILRFYPAHKLLELDETSRALDTNPSIFDQSGSKRHQSKPNLGDLLEGLVPYTQRHFSRSDRAYSQESFVLDYTLRQMDAGISLLVEDEVDGIA